MAKKVDTKSVDYYKQIRSKHVKGADGYGKKVTPLREKLIEQNGGKDPGYNVVAAHTKPGPHPGDKGDDIRGKFKSRRKNSSEAGKLRVARMRKKLRAGKDS
jgi:hypothetical protein